jgi:prolipoprotein diacylglyceryl transferase
MAPILNIGPLAIQLPGLILLLGLWLGLSLAERHSATRGVSANTLYNLVFVSLIAGAIGARLAYIARYPSAFSANPLSVISLNPGLLDPVGGVASALLAALIYGQRKSIGFWQALDALTPVFAVLSVAMSLANLASGAGFGSPTNLPWGIPLWGAVRHPTQIYETLAAAIILAILWPGRERARSLQTGVYFLSFAAVTSASRLFLEAFRGDSQLLPSGIRAAQLVAWLVLAACLWGIYKLQGISSSNQNDKTQEDATF